MIRDLLVYDEIFTDMVTRIHSIPLIALSVSIAIFTIYIAFDAAECLRRSDRDEKHKMF